MSKKIVIIISVIAAIAVATSLSVLIWWFVAGRYAFSTIRLEGNGLGDVEFTAAYTRLPFEGDMFWWFYPTTSSNKIDRPIVLWLDGVVGLPPSIFANFFMFGPYDVNMNRRANSWINSYNLLFVDAPLGTGFSKALDGGIPNSLNKNAEHLEKMLQSFYSLHSEYRNTPLYIFGQGDGAKLAVSLAIQYTRSNQRRANLKGVLIGNGIISPAVVMTRMGFYLEELAYIYGNGRVAVEQLSNDINKLVQEEKWEEAFDEFTQLGDFINEKAGAIAVNMRHIIDKLDQNYTSDFFGHSFYINKHFSSMDEAYRFMDTVVAAGLGIPDSITYDAGRDDAIKVFRKFLMHPATQNVERILEETEVPVIIYNGNLDAVSNTPGQLEWVNNLSWSGQQQFLNSTRNTLVINSYIEGYFRESPRLTFYWVNVAGQAAPMENPVAVRRILDRTTSS